MRPICTFLALLFLLFSVIALFGQNQSCTNPADIAKMVNPVRSTAGSLALEGVHATRDAVFGCGLGTQMGACSVPGTWPPKGIETFDPWHLPLLNTLLLLTSGTTVTWAHHALLENNRQGLKYGLILTILLGATFTCVQAYEYSHAAFSFAGNIYGATFFMATGFHGFHVLVGTIFLIVCLVRAYLGHFTPKQHLGFEFAAWYWHFVDVVWLFLFVCIYVWGHGAETMAHGAH